MEVSGVLFDLLMGVVIVCTVLLTKYLIPYFKLLIEQSKYADLLDMVDSCVEANEQKFKQSKMGPAKKAEVIKFISCYLADHDIHITEEHIDNLIEAAVFTMNNVKKKKNKED